MAPLCAEFGISRKTGYTIDDRCKGCGIHALIDRSRRPYRRAGAAVSQVAAPLANMLGAQHL